MPTTPAPRCPDPYRSVLLRAAWTWVAFSTLGVGSTALPWQRAPWGDECSAAYTLRDQGLAAVLAGATWVCACAFVLACMLSANRRAPLSPDRAHAIGGAFSALLSLGVLTWSYPFWGGWGSRQLSGSRGCSMPFILGRTVDIWPPALATDGSTFLGGFSLAVGSMGASVVLLLGLPLLLARAHRRWQATTETAPAADAPRFAHTAYWQFLWTLLGVVALDSTWKEGPADTWRGIEALWGSQMEVWFPGVRLGVIGLVALAFRAVATVLASTRARPEEWRPSSRWSRLAWHPIGGLLALSLWGVPLVFSWEALTRPPTGLSVFAIAWLGAFLTELSHAAIPWVARALEPAPGPHPGDTAAPLATAYRRAAWVRLGVLAMAFLTLLLPWGVVHLDSSPWVLRPATGREILAGLVPATEMPGQFAVFAGMLALACMAAWDVCRARDQVPPPTSHAWAFAGWLCRLALGLPIVALWAYGHASFSSSRFTPETYGRGVNLVLCGAFAVLLLGYLPLELYRGLRGRALRAMDLHRSGTMSGP